MFIVNKYTNIKQKVVRVLRERPDVLKVCTFGSLSTQGLSDIDFLVVVSDDYKPLILSDFVSHDEFELISHEPFIVNKKIFRHLESFFYFTNLYDEFEQRPIELGSTNTDVKTPKSKTPFLRPFPAV